MEVVESLLCRLPSNWWWPIFPSDCQHHDFIFKSEAFPIPHEFMVSALADSNLLSRGVPIITDFNQHFSGKLVLADLRKRGEKRMFYVRVAGKKKITHLPIHQIHGVVSKPINDILRPDYRKVYAGRATQLEIIKYSDLKGIELVASIRRTADSLQDLVGVSLDNSNNTKSESKRHDTSVNNCDKRDDSEVEENEDGTSVECDGRGDARINVSVYDSMLEEYGVKKKDERRLLKELVNKYTNSAGYFSTTSMRNNAKAYYVKIPSIGTKNQRNMKIMADQRLKNGFMRQVITIFSNFEEDNHGAKYIASYLGSHYCDHLLDGARSLGYIIGEKLTTLETAAMWTESTVHQKSKQRVIISHLVAKFGTSMFASLKSVENLILKNPAAERFSGVFKYKKVESIVKTDSSSREQKITEKDVTYYVECPFQNTMLELRSRLSRGEAMPGYTLGANGNRFIVVNDGGDHGNVAFRQAITVLSKDDCTAGNVLITARILEHEDYYLWQETIYPVLSSGISRLQSTGFVILRTENCAQIIPVPYKAALGSANPMNRDESLFLDTSSHTDFVVLDTDPDDQTQVVGGSLELVEDSGYLSHFAWKYCINGFEHIDSIELENKDYRMCDLKSVTCLPTAVIGIGDIPYQAFMLGKLNMGTCHCNYCTCPASLFGKEEDCKDIKILTQANLITTGIEIIKHKLDLKAGKKVGKYSGIQGITHVPFSRIPISLHMLASLHMGLGHLCDNTNRMQRFIMARIYNYDKYEYLLLRDKALLESKLSETQKLLNTYENLRAYHFNRSKEIIDKDEKKKCLDMRSNMILKIKELSTNVETKKLKKDNETLGRKIKIAEGTRDKLKTSAVYIFDSCLKEIGCDRNAFHKGSIDGNKGRVLMERREEFGKLLYAEMKKCIAATKEDRRNILDGEADTLGLASEEELKGEIEFMVQTLNLLNCIWPKIRTTRETIICDEELRDLQKDINTLKLHWCCKRDWEKKTISVTPKWHLLFYHMIDVLTKYRRICHMAEDPVERTHAEDKHLERNFAHIRNDVNREACKGKVRLLKRNPDVINIIEDRKTKRKRILKNITILKKEKIAEEKVKVKIESRDGDKTFDL